MNRQMNQEEGGKKKKTWTRIKMMHEGCKMNEKMKLKRKTKTFLKKCLLPLSICISPTNFSPMIFSSYECARCRISPPKNVHMSHIEMTKHTSILFGIFSPFLSRIDKKQSRGRRERKEDMNKGKRWCIKGARRMRK